MQPPDRPDPEGSIEIRVGTRLLPGDIRHLCETARRQLTAADARHLVCTVAQPADLGAIDALARLQLLTRQLGASLRVHPTEDLQRMLRLTGLDGILTQLGEPVGQPEPREERRVEEVVDVRDPAP